MNLPPVAGATLVAAAIILQIVATKLHVDGVLEYIAQLAAFGVVIMWGASHAQTVAKLQESRTELEQLHKSLMPPREPSMASLPPMPPASQLPKE
jgi:hypothetical protein